MSDLSGRAKSVNGFPNFIQQQSRARVFIVHRHLGSILHYDLRIQINGVLKSWAIPKGPSMNPGDRRLAIQTRDQPLTLVRFRGTIPEGYYGAGLVEKWDGGACEPHSFGTAACNDRQLLSQLREGRLKFTLKGKKLKGVFSLVRIESGHWLLIKGNDRYSVDHHYDPENFVGMNSPINRFLGGSGNLAA